MGIFSKIFGTGSARPSGPTTVTRHGRTVIEVSDTFPITGRGLVVTGQLLAPVSTDERFDVFHDGSTQELRLARITVEDQMVDSVPPGQAAALLLAKPGVDSNWFAM